MLMGWTRISFKPPQYSDLDSVSSAPMESFMDTGYCSLPIRGAPPPSPPLPPPSDPLWVVGFSLVHAECLFQ